MAWFYRFLIPSFFLILLSAQPANAISSTGKILIFDPSEAILQVPYGAPFPLTASVASSTGAGTVGFGSSVGVVSSLTAFTTSSAPQLASAGFSFPFGLFSFRVTGILSGQTVSVEIVAPSNYPSNTVWVKLTATGQVIIINPTILSGNVMMISLTDGGTGDRDGVANGVIDDPGGPGVPFSLFIAPSSRQVTAGQSATYDVTVTGAALPTSLSISPLPSGVTSSFNPASGTPPFTSKLTISTTSSAAQGSITFTVTATSAGPATTTTTASILILPLFDFSVAISPSSTTVSQGQAAVYTVNVNLILGTTTGVVLTVTGLPNVALVQFNPVSGNPSFQSTLIVSTSSSTPPGSFNFTVTASSSAGLTRSSTATLSIFGITPSPSPPTIPPPPVPFDFNLQISPTSLTITRGGSGIVIIRVDKPTSPSQLVTLIVSSLPAGSTVGLSPQQGVPPYTATIEIKTDPTSTPVGLSFLTVRASGGGVTKTANANIIVEAPLATVISPTPTATARMVPTPIPGFQGETIAFGLGFALLLLLLIRRRSQRLVK